MLGVLIVWCGGIHFIHILHVQVFQVTMWMMLMEFDHEDDYYYYYDNGCAIVCMILLHIKLICYYIDEHTFPETCKLS